MAKTINFLTYAGQHWKELLWSAFKETITLFSILIATYSALASFAPVGGPMYTFFQFFNNWLFRRMFVFLLLLLIYLIFIIKNWPRMKAEYHDERTDTTVIIERADIFKQEGLKVIHTVDTFDTELDKIISRRSLNGAFLAQCEKEKIDVAAIVNRYLGNIQEEGSDSSLPGNEKRYQLGTVCPLTVNEHPFVLVSFAHLQTDGSISITSQEYVGFFMKMWENLSKANIRQDEINMVIMGNKFVDLPSEYSTEQKIDIMTQTFFVQAQKHNICKTLRICIHQNDVMQVDFHNYPVIFDHIAKRPAINI